MCGHILKAMSVWKPGTYQLTMVINSSTSPE